MATGNTPTGNPGAGTRETTSAPDPVATPGTAPTPTTGNVGPNTGNPAPGSMGPVTPEVTLDESAFRKDGNIRADVARKINENVSPRGAQRSYNEVTDETTVTTVVNGQTVTFTESGDTRGGDK